MRGIICQQKQSDYIFSNKSSVSFTEQINEAGAFASNKLRPDNYKHAEVMRYATE